MHTTLHSTVQTKYKLYCSAIYRVAHFKGFISKCLGSELTNNFVLAGVSVLLVVSFFILFLKAMSRLAILFRLASGLVCISKLVSQSGSYLRAAIL